LYFQRHFNNFRNAFPAAISSNAHSMGAADGDVHVKGLRCE
jgi:hypothetical protein